MTTYTTEEIWRNAPEGATHHSADEISGTDKGIGFFFFAKPRSIDGCVKKFWKPDLRNPRFVYDNLGHHDLTSRDWRETLTERPI